MSFPKNFTLDELTITNTGYYNIPQGMPLTYLARLANNVLQPIRDKWNAPIIVNSAYRCKELNAAVGGAKNSGHQYGYCADLQVKGDLRKFSCFVKYWMEKHKMAFDELLYEKSGGVTWLHFCWIGKDGKQRMKCFDIIK